MFYPIKFLVLATSLLYASLSHAQTNQEFVRGINVFFSSTDYHPDNMTHAVDQLTDRLQGWNVDHISITWLIYTDGCRGNIVYAGEKTPSLAGIKHFATVAQRRGLKVWLRPIIDETNIVTCGSGWWRGNINPSDPEEWFSSYRDLLTSYATIGQEVNATGIVIGTELTSLEKYQQSWRLVTESLRSQFPEGDLIYASNRGISENFPWDAVDVIGVDAFFRMRNLPCSASVEQITNGFNHTEEYGSKASLLQQAADLDMPLVFMEVGTTSQECSWRSSLVWDNGGTAEQDGQQRYYQAVCQAWRTEISGIFWWHTHLYPLENPEQDRGYDPDGKTAEQVLTDCFSL